MGVVRAFVRRDRDEDSARSIHDPGLWFSAMIAVVVHIEVDPERVEEFKAVALRNAAGSRAETGCRQFDVVQQLDDPARFVLYETYDSEEAIEAHYATPHFQTWRESTADPGFVLGKVGLRYGVLGGGGER